MSVAVAYLAWDLNFLLWVKQNSACCLTRTFFKKENYFHYFMVGVALENVAVAMIFF